MSDFKYIIYFFVFLYNVSSLGQVPTYKKVKTIKSDKFNYTHKIKTKNSSELKLIYSDRVKNYFYTTPYLTDKTSLSKDLLTPFYVIRERENAYEVVLANPEQIGKPKGFFSMFFSGKYNFKDAKTVTYLGWIPKNNVVNYSHSFVNSFNNKPIKYKLGTSDLSRLYDMKPYMDVDSIFVFNDPFLKSKSNKKLVSNQVIYPYKYNQTKKTVFISNKSTLKDSINLIAGWIPANLITQIGQGKVFLSERKHRLEIHKPYDTLLVEKQNRYSKFLYATKNTIDQELDSLLAPINIWNHEKNKLINVNGNNFYTKDIPKIKEEFKTINIHFISDISNLSSIKTILNSLQNLYISLFEKPGEFKYSFSAVLINKNEKLVLERTTSFAKWIDFIENFVILKNNFNQHKNSVSQKTSIVEVLDNVLKNSSNNKFENNLVIICSNKENVKSLDKLTDEFFDNLAKKSPKIIFVQLENKTTDKYQDYLLASKEFLYRTGKSYTKFIKEYIVDNEVVVKNNLLKPIMLNDDNAYVYDAPKNSLFNGGIVFPKIEKSLTPLSLEVTVDTVLKRTNLTNDKLISSLVYFDKKLGVLRSSPTKLMEGILKTSQKYSDTLAINDIDRNNLHEVLYQKVALVNDSVPKSGYILNKQEILNLIDDYRTIFPKMKEPITKSKRRKIKKLSLKQMRNLNKTALRKVLNRKLTFADLFYKKSGIPLHHKGFYCLRITKLPRKTVGKIGFENFYLKNYKKIDAFEEMFLKNKLQKVTKGYHDEMYFIPSNLLP